MREVEHNGAPVKFLEMHCKKFPKQSVTADYREVENRYGGKSVQDVVYKYY
jgi:hypothetical protein